MSFDLYIDSECGTFSEDIGNYTSNMGGFFRWALSADGALQDSDKGRCDSRDGILGADISDGLYGLDGWSAAEAIPILKRGIKRAEDAPSAVLKGFDAPNGWGSSSGALEYLRKILTACEEHPKGKLRVWA